MKKKLLFIPALVLGLVAGAGAAVAIAKPQKALKVKAETAASAITDSMYEVAFFEQYNGGAEYGYTNDKPLAENNALGGHVYGNSGGARQENFVTNSLYGVNETLEWKFTCGRVKNDTANGFITFGIESHSTTGNIFDETAYPDGTDEHAIGVLTKGSADNVTECSAMIMQSYITELNDFSVYWRNAPYGTKFSICYQIEGQDWKRLDNKGNFSGGTRGWDALGYSTFNSGSWTTKDLYKAKVRLAFGITNSGSDHGNFRPSAIIINSNNAAVKYLNALSYREGICTTDSQFDLNLGQASNRHNQDLFHLATERADAEFLGEYYLTGTKSSEYYALGLYNHLVTEIPALGSVKVPSSQMMLVKSNSSNIIAIVCISTSVVAIAAGGLLIGLKKKKHQ